MQTVGRSTYRHGFCCPAPGSVPIIASGCANNDSAMVPPGVEAATGIMSVVALKSCVPESTDPILVAYGDFMKARLPNVDPDSIPWRNFATASSPW